MTEADFAISLASAYWKLEGICTRLILYKAQGNGWDLCRATAWWIGSPQCIKLYLPGSSSTWYLSRMFKSYFFVLHFIESSSQHGHWLCWLWESGSLRMNPIIVDQWFLTFVTQMLLNCSSQKPQSAQLVVKASGSCSPKLLSNPRLRTSVLGHCLNHFVSRCPQYAA